ncbi:MAG TPA: hypothetical protein DD734_13200, partial [Firmicutes bacterium]|nr:hypothetical protein [Bacillota bacterium]
MWKLLSRYGRRTKKTPISIRTNLNVRRRPLRTLGLIGGGLMATALIKGLFKQGYPAAQIYGSDPDPASRQRLEELGVKTFASNQTMLTALSQNEAAGVILAVKPQVVPEALSGLEYPDLPLLSIVAGYELAALEALLP